MVIYFFKNSLGVKKGISIFYLESRSPCFLGKLFTCSLSISSNLIDLSTELPVAAPHPDYINSDVPDPRKQQQPPGGRDPFDMSPFSVTAPGGGIPSPVTPTPVTAPSQRSQLAKYEVVEYGSYCHFYFVIMFKCKV